MYAWWIGALIDLAFITAAVLFAINYHFIWYDILQRFEPLTPEMGRICRKRPWLFYGFTGILIVASFAAAILLNWWAWRVIHIIIVGFFAWLLPHVAAAAYNPDNPPHLRNWFTWAKPDCSDFQLRQDLEDARAVNRDHQKLNGKLREELKLANDFIGNRGK